MNSSLIDHFLTLLQVTFTEEYKQLQTSNCKQTFQACFQLFLIKYADINEVDRTANKAEMIQP